MEKFDFLLSAKQTKQGEKSRGGGFWASVASSLKSKNTLKNPVCSGENLTGGTLKVGSLDLFSLPYPVASEALSSSQTAQVTSGHNTGLPSTFSGY